MRLHTIRYRCGSCGEYVTNSEHEDGLLLRCPHCGTTPERGFFITTDQVVGFWVIPERSWWNPLSWFGRARWVEASL